MRLSWDVFKRVKIMNSESIFFSKRMQRSCFDNLHNNASNRRYQFKHQTRRLALSLTLASHVNSEMSLVNYISQQNFTIRNAGKVN